MAEIFESFKGWIAARELCLVCYRLVRKFPTEERFALADQIRRAVVSIPSNIAEGLSRSSAKDIIHFFVIAQGSIYEIMTQIDIAHEMKYISLADKREVFEKSKQALRLINGYKKYQKGASNV